jgi:hypothetical protein
MTKIVFRSVVVIAFEKKISSKMHQNNIFLFLKNHFSYHRVKTI